WYESKAYPMPDGGLSIYFRDVTERKDAERSLHFQAAVLGQVNDAVIAIDNEQLITYFNPAAERQYGLPAARALGRPLREVYEFRWSQPEDEAAAYAALNRDGFWRGENAHVRLDGRKLYVESAVSVLKDEEGLATGLLAVIRNVTERKRAEDALRKSEEQARLALEIVRLGTWSCEEGPEVVVADARSREICGLDPEAPLSYADVASLVHPEDWPRVESAIEHALRPEGDGLYIEEFRVVHPDGSVRWVRSRGRTLFKGTGEDRRPRLMLGTIFDVTERKRSQEEITRLLTREQAARQEAEEATRAKDEFLAVVSHELRSPLNSILGWNRLLRSKYGDQADILQASAAIERAGRAQLQLIEDLLDTARIISGKLRLEVGPVDLARVVALAVDTVRPMAESKGVALVPMLITEVGQITGDPDRLQQVVWNLISNAVKFTPAGGRVEIELQRGPADVRIVVRDTGEGISSDLLPQIFDRFKQGESDASRRFGGLGLGLALVKQLVESHGGTVTAESQGLQMGATFTVRLPLRAVLTGEREMASTALSARYRLDGLRILIVDDEENARALIALTLARCGAQVAQAESASTALTRLIDDRPFDVLISDIEMSGEDGYSLIRKVRSLDHENLRRIPAVALTAYTRSEDRVLALQAGFQMHVAKPVEPEELVIVINALTGKALTKGD
ncbi:MAG TPA: ATP-binding protein, partial [Blastocatellia bacterium]|nr:ATP-binding protein [Blastocatellia bacterium]